MKKIAILLAGLPLLFLGSCKDADSRYYDLNSGKQISIEKDPETGYMINAETKKPVTIYVDTKTDDTIYGRSGKVINGKIVKEGDGTYKYDDDGGYKVKNGDYKMEVEKDGDVKIKDGDTKTKIDGETGEKKVKKD